MSTKKKNRLFDFFNYHRDNQIDAIEEDTTPTLKRYFKVLGRRFWKLVTLNLMMLPLILPILLGVYLYLGVSQTPSANDFLFPQLYNANALGSTPATVFLLDLFGGQLFIPVYGGNSLPIYIGIALLVLFLVVTFGWQNIGATYILRNIVRGEPVFLWSDYFYAIKRNLKQGLLIGILDAVVIFVLGFDIMTLWNTTGSFITDVCFFGICALIILYFFMRFYMYLMLVTFDLSIRKILKNALIFTMLGIKRNLMAVLGIVLLTALNIVLFFAFGATPLGIAIPLILPFFYYLSFTAFTSAYAAYPIIDRYMIAPYVGGADTSEEAEEESEEVTEQ